MNRKIICAFAACGISVICAGASSAAPKKPAAGDGHRMTKMAHSRYGGPSYTGKPALTVTASLVEAGGGPRHFSAATALTAMVGKEMVNKEVGKLNKQYGEEKVKSWLAVFDFAVADALKIATGAGVKLPHGNLKGKALAATLVKAGLDKTNTFYVEYLLDKALSHGIHEKVMDDIDAKYGATADADYHRITNQAMVDLAHALGMNNVKTAAFH